ncbi:DUF748 domain-containing protein [Allohahella marinimesophila]|uniref:DUF748 domain-containing protein n=1 Tax=Allohahella marinimesophila TaxID=1054972 RepID=A0ABP7Q0W1_9GAMM
MNVDTRLTTKQWFKSKLFWLLFVILLYTLIGFFLVPYLVKSYTHDLFQEKFGWEGGPADVSFNPFEFALQMKDLDVWDESGTRVLGFSELAVNFDLGSIYYQAWTLEPSHVNDAYVFVEVDESGETNFGKAYDEHATVEETSEPAGSLPRILLKKIVIADAQFEVDDQSQGQLVEHDVSPVNLIVEDFVTYEGRDGRYSASMTFGESQALEWEGSIDAEPYRSRGVIDLSSFKVPHLWPYVEPYVNYRITEGEVSARVNYDFSLPSADDQPLHLTLSKGEVEFSNVKAAIPNTDAFDDESLGTMKALGVHDLSYDYAKSELAIDEAYLRGLDLSLVRNDSGQINLLWPYADDNDSEQGGETESENESDAASNSSDTNDPFKWQISKTDISESRLTWTDNTLENPAAISLNSIAATMQNLDQNLDEAKAFEASLQPENSGAISLQGTVTPATVEATTSLTIDALSIPLAQNYVSEFMNVRLNSGTVSAQGQLKLTGDNQIGSFDGTITSEDFDASDPVLEEALLGWESVTVEPLQVVFQPVEIDIETITLSKPSGQFRIGEDGNTNFSALTTEGGEEQQADSGGTESDDSIAAEAPPFINIARIQINEAQFHFMDNSLEPAVDLPMESLNGSITELSSAQQVRSDVALEGAVGEFGEVGIEGTVNPLAEQLFVDLGINVENFSLTQVSPYSVKFLGRKIEEGKLRLKLEYLVQDGELDASNSIVISDFSFGEKVESESALDLPIDLAIALLKDRSGRISLDVPVDGSLDDPDFDISAILWQAFQDVLKKAVTSPFALVGKLLGGDEEKLEAIRFDAGSHTLSGPASESLKQLSRALQERPSLTLAVQGRAVREIDGPALAQARLDKALEDRRQKGLDEVAAYRDYLRSEGVELPTPQDESASDEYVEAHRTASLETAKVSEDALQRLAVSRSQSIGKALATDYQVDPEQLQTSAPDIDAEAEGEDNEQVEVRFQLSAR